MKTPALDLWRRELAAGRRTAVTFDPLWKAACAEQCAIEFTATGLPSLAESCLRDGRRIIRDAARGKVA